MWNINAKERKRVLSARSDPCWMPLGSLHKRASVFMAQTLCVCEATHSFIRLSVQEGHHSGVFEEKKLVIQCSLWLVSVSWMEKKVICEIFEHCNFPLFPKQEPLLWDPSASGNDCWLLVVEKPFLQLPAKSSTFGNDLTTSQFWVSVPDWHPVLDYPHAYLIAAANLICSNFAECCVFWLTAGSPLTKTGSRTWTWRVIELQLVSHQVWKRSTVTAEDSHRGYFHSNSGFC